MKTSGSFKPGQSGNPSGKPRGLERLVRETIGADFVAVIKAQLSIAKGIQPDGIPNLPTIKASDMTKAAEWLADRGWGKARQTVDIGSEINLDTLDLTKLSTEELDDLITKAEAEAAQEESDAADSSASDDSPAQG